MRLTRFSDGGFSLIEVVVFFVAVGLVSFLGKPMVEQKLQDRADRALKSDLQSASITTQAWKQNHPRQNISPSSASGGFVDLSGQVLDGFRPANGNRVTIHPGATHGSYVIYASNEDASGGPGRCMVFNSEAGGIQNGFHPCR